MNGFAEMLEVEGRASGKTPGGALDRDLRRSRMISALVLAAGTSSRMRAPKPVVEVGGRPLLAHVLEAVRAARIDETVVVLGADAEQVRSKVPLDGARSVENPGYRDGMSSSLRAGLAALSPRSDAFFVVLADAPFVRPETYDTLISARERSGARIVLPTFHGIRGNPVLLDRSLAGEVDAITGDIGCRALRLRHPDETLEVPVDDPGVLIDLDTPEELARAQDLVARGQPLGAWAEAEARERHPLAAGSRAVARPRTRRREDLLAVVAELERKREPFCLAIVTRVVAPTSGKPGFKAIVRPDGSIVGWVGGSCSRHALIAESRAALRDGTPRLLRLRPGDASCPPAAPGVVDRVLECQSGGAMDIYLEPHGPKPQIVVVGDSPLAEALSSLGRLLDFRVLVAGVGIDPTRFPDADEVVTDLKVLPAKLDRDSYAVVATMATYDAMAVELLARSAASYVALVASRARARALFDDLRSRGIPEAALARVRNPAGLDLGARSPEEIAVSIAAEIVRERHAAPSTPAGTPEEPVAGWAIDPVCRMEVDPSSTSLKTEHEGRTFFFCSEACLRRFQKDPGSFVSGTVSH